MYSKSKLIQFSFNLFLGLDQLVNVLLLGDPDDSISGRCGRAISSGKPKWWVKPLAKLIDWGAYKLFKQEKHCIVSQEPEDAMDYELWNWSKK